MCDYGNRFGDGKNRSTERQTKLKTLEQKRPRRLTCITKIEIPGRGNYRNERITIDERYEILCNTSLAI